MALGCHRLTRLQHFRQLIVVEPVIRDHCPHFASHTVQDDVIWVVSKSLAHPVEHELFLVREANSVPESGHFVLYLIVSDIAFLDASGQWPEALTAFNNKHSRV